MLGSVRRTCSRPQGTMERPPLAGLFRGLGSIPQQAFCRSVYAHAPVSYTHLAAAAVVAGTVEPLCAALAVRVDEVEAPGLLSFGGGVDKAHGHAAHAGQVDRLAVFLVADFQVVGRAGADSGKRVTGQACLLYTSRCV